MSLKISANVSDYLECLRPVRLIVVCVEAQIRLTESKQNSAASASVSAEQAEKVVKLEGWRQELHDLEVSLTSLSSI